MREKELVIMARGKDVDRRRSCMCDYFLLSTPYDYRSKIGIAIRAIEESYFY